MFNRNELTISMFYASTTDADSNRRHYYPTGE